MFVSSRLSHRGSCRSLTCKNFPLLLSPYVCLLAMSPHMSYVCLTELVSHLRSRCPHVCLTHLSHVFVSRLSHRVSRVCLACVPFDSCLLTFGSRVSHRGSCRPRTYRTSTTDRPRRHWRLLPDSGNRLHLHHRIVKSMKTLTETRGQSSRRPWPEQLGY